MCGQLPSHRFASDDNWLLGEIPIIVDCHRHTVILINNRFKLSVGRQFVARVLRGSYNVLFGL